MRRCTICTDLHVYDISHESGKLATNVTFLNSSHEGPEPQSLLKHLVQNQTHYETDLDGEINGAQAFSPNVSQKCNLAYLKPQSGLKNFILNQNHYETNLNGEMKRGWTFSPKAGHKVMWGIWHKKENPMTLISIVNWKAIIFIIKKLPWMTFSKFY